MEERGYSMITDKQGREWVLEKLYNDGWRYYAKNIGGTAFLTTKKPIMGRGILEITSGGTTKCINIISKIMPEIDRNGLIDIAEELGIADWSKVKVDTPILVKAYEQDDWQKRYFAYFKDGIVYAWLCGTTSWSADNDEDVMSWNCAKLAEV